MQKILGLILTLTPARNPVRAETIKLAVGQKGFWDTSIASGATAPGSSRRRG